MFKLVCPKCGGEEVGYEATASWDKANQRLELGSHYDSSWCNVCGDVEVKKVPLTDDERAEALVIQAEPCEAEIALKALIAGAKSHDSKLNNDEQEGGPRSPTGDDYNFLVALIGKAAKAAGLPSPL